MSLQGKQILVTRSLRGSLTVRRQISALGGVAICVPTTRQVAVPVENATWQTLLDLPAIDLMVFTSKNGCRFFCRALKKQFGHVTDNLVLESCRQLLAVGQETAAFLSRLIDRPVDYPPRPQGADRLIEYIRKNIRRHVAWQQVVFPRAKEVEPGFKIELEKIGLSVVDFAVYETVDRPAAWPTAGSRIDAFLIYSGSQARALARYGLEGHLLDRPAICLGERTANVLKELGFTDVRPARSSSKKGVLECLKSL